MMKKLLPVICAMGLFAQPALAANNLTLLNALDQNMFNALTEDLGSALSYKAVTPPNPLGITGFDLGLEITQTSMAKSSQFWALATGSGNAVPNLYVPKLHLTKGLPFGLDVGFFLAKSPNTNISLSGGELRYAIIDNIALPTVSIRGAFTKLSGVDQLSFNTKSVDIGVAKSLLLITPYAGVGKVWTNSSTTVASLWTGAPLSSNISQNKVYGGLNLNLGLMNFALEVDKTGAARSSSLKMGFRW